MSNRHWSTRTQKVMWLVEHPELLTASAAEMKVAFVAAGLTAPSTYALDLGPKQLVKEAQRIIAERTKEPA